MKANGKGRGRAFRKNGDGLEKIPARNRPTYQSYGWAEKNEPTVLKSARENKRFVGNQQKAWP